LHGRQKWVSRRRAAAERRGIGWLRVMHKAGAVAVESPGRFYAPVGIEIQAALCGLQSESTLDLVRR
jgi:hypothetical protein